MRQRPKASGFALLLMLLAARHAASSAEAASVARQCRKVCRDEIAACVAAGGRLRACWKSTLGRRKRDGLAVCQTQASADAGGRADALHRHRRGQTTTTTTPPTTTTTITTTGTTTTTTRPTTSSIQTVFLIVMENHDWSSIKNSASAPYINRTLLPIASHAEQYYNPPSVHPSLPNYLWLEAGTNFGIFDDNLPSQNHQSTSNHLVNLLEAAGISWMTYQEDEGSGAYDGTDCPITNEGNFYDVNHNPFVYFDDVTGNLNPSAPRCLQHVRPYSEFLTDLVNNTVD